MYTKSELAILALDYQDISYKKICDIVFNVQNLEEIFDKKNTQFLQNYLSQKEISFLTEMPIEQIEKLVLSDLDKFGIVAVTFASNDYPLCLKNIDDPPMVLYLIGNVNLLAKQKIGVVGTRKPTTYGKDVARKFSAELVEAGLVTISGLSYGIDACCAEATLNAGGKHIAVLAGGLDNIYPCQNQDLSKQIVTSGGLLVSEYRPFVRPKQYTFIARNRIVSGLSDGLLVVEAGKQSGTKSTANFCINQGRELFVVPGNIFSPQSAGTNELINEIPDCFTISTEQILNRLNIEPKQSKQTSNAQLSLLGQQIIELLTCGDMHFDQIAEQINAPANAVASELSMLEIMGAIHKEAGNYYSLAH